MIMADFCQTAGNAAQGEKKKHIKRIPTDTCAPCVSPSMHVHTQNAGRQATAD